MSVHQASNWRTKDANVSRFICEQVRQLPIVTWCTIAILFVLCYNFLHLAPCITDDCLRCSDDGLLCILCEEKFKLDIPSKKCEFQTGRRITDAEVVGNKLEPNCSISMFLY